MHAKGDALSLPPIEHAAQLPIDKADRFQGLWRASPTIVRGNIGLAEGEDCDVGPNLRPDYVEER